MFCDNLQVLHCQGVSGLYIFVIKLRIQYNCMSMDFLICCLMVLFVIPIFMELSVVMGVGSCLWPISSSVLHITYPSHFLVNKPPNSASDDKDIAFFIIPEMERIVLLCIFCFEEFSLFTA